MNLRKNLLLWIIITVVMLVLFDVAGGNNGGSHNNLSFSDFLNRVDSREISSVAIRGHMIDGTLSNGQKFSTHAPNYPNLIDRLNNAGVAINVMPTETKMGSLFGILISWFPMILLIGVWLYFMKQMNTGAGKAMGFGKSKAKLNGISNTKVSFADVAGIDEAKEELTEIVDFLKNPTKFQALGGKIPRGCLLIGSPGTGKTLIAKAVAGEAHVPFFSISGSDFVEMFVGVGASRVRDMFAQGKKNSPCIIFIDEIDAVGRHRGMGMGGGNDEREQTLNQLLVEMDGFEQNDAVIIIAATNRPDVLDPALLRPGRFDRQIHVPTPDIKGREQILDVHLKKIVIAPDIDVNSIARGTPGFTGADLANLVNEAALLAARLNKKIVTTHELEEAKDKVMMGPQRKSMIMSDNEKKITAYHEGGHALVTLHSPASDPIHKATIIPRGRALGLVMRLPTSDQFSVTRAKLKADLAVAMGGRVAEEIIFGYDKVTSGASSDIQQATKIARAMVREWGMSDNVGPINYGGNSQDMYAQQNQKLYSVNTEDLIDQEVKRLVNDSYELAKKILTTHLDQLHKVAKSLLEKETLTGDELKELVFGKAAVQKDKKSTEKSTSTTKTKTVKKAPAKKTNKTNKK
ncbi:MAG: ATP-dependent zinc metalloprotease FtsH [Alphaproteobacteria bacterium]|nr:ATP-dependent zinc metalloprotease FtsH [Alphaproteobacteria bacterium]